MLTVLGTIILLFVVPFLTALGILKMADHYLGD